jgi:hypothetical protein
MILGLCRSSRPQAPTAVQDVLLVNIKVKKLPSHRQLLGPVNIKKTISCYTISHRNNIPKQLIRNHLQEVGIRAPLARCVPQLLVYKGLS